MEFATLCDALRHYAAHSPDKTFLIDAASGNECTYQDFWARCVGFSQKLLALGAGSGHGEYPGRIVVRVGGFIETTIAQFAIYLAGCVYCPVEKHMKAPKLREMMAYYDSLFLISTEHIDGVNWIDLEKVGQGGYSSSGQVNMPRPEDLSTIVFTTGTTGKAKGVMHTHRTHYENAAVWTEDLGLNGDDVFLRVQPLERAGGVFHFLSVVIVGATVVHHEGVVFAKGLFQAIEKYSVTATYMQPPMVGILLGADEEKFAGAFGRLRLFTMGGTAISEAYKAKLAALMPNTECNVIYAATECIKITKYRFDNDLGKPNCVGKPVEGATVVICDEKGEKLYGADTQGVIAVSGSAVFKGYWKDDKLTEQVLHNGRLLMTDIGYMDDEGYLYVLGRRDDVIVSGGYKIAPYEVEEAAMAFGGVAECACIGVPDKVLGEIPKLFVKMQAGTEFSSKEIYDYLAGHLESYKLPRAIVEVEEFPRMGNVPKINRKELRG